MSDKAKKKNKNKKTIPRRTSLGILSFIHWGPNWRTGGSPITIPAPQPSLKLGHPTRANWGGEMGKYMISTVEKIGHLFMGDAFVEVIKLLRFHSWLKISAIEMVNRPPGSSGGMCNQGPGPILQARNPD